MLINCLCNWCCCPDSQLFNSTSILYSHVLCPVCVGKVYLSDEMSCGQSCLYWLAYLLIHSRTDGQQMFPVYISLTFKFSFSDIWVFAAMPKPNSYYQLGIMSCSCSICRKLIKKSSNTKWPYWLTDWCEINHIQFQRLTATQNIHSFCIHEQCKYSCSRCADICLITKLWWHVLKRFVHSISWFWGLGWCMQSTCQLWCWCITSCITTH